MRDPELSELDMLHRQWEQVHSRLRSREEELSAAIARYARGQGGRPVELMAEVEALRTECAQKFQALIAGVRRGSTE